MYDFILACFLIKNTGQATSDTELAILPDTPVCISTVQVRCQLFPPTFIFNIVTLMALIKSSCLVKEKIFQQVNNAVRINSHANLRPQICQQTIGGFGSAQNEPNQQLAWSS